MSPPAPQSERLAFKAYEIEERADVYFFRPLGMVAARAARAIRMTPAGVTLAGGLVGVAGGALLYDQALGLLGCAVLVLHSILDSADGQLARMTGQVSDRGRVLDGVSGYFTHASIYLALAASAAAQGAGVWTILLAAGAALSNVVHAALYDYHRHAYALIAIQGVPTGGKRSDSDATAASALHFYERVQRGLAGTHHAVELAVADRSARGRVLDDDRARYRDCFYHVVRGWNVLGDNTRIYAIGVLAWLHRLDWFFGVVLLPMNVALIVLWCWQARADHRFLNRL